MALIVDNPSLQAAVTEYLARDQDTTLIARIPTFIQFFEAKMNRSLYVRQMEVRSAAVSDPTLVTEPEFIALPSDFQSMRRIRISDSPGKPPLEFITNVQMDEYRRERLDATGRPRFFTIFGNEIELFPTPGVVHTYEMVYRQNIPSLNANNTNWLITLAPDAYLYGSLMEASPYIKQDSRIQTWGAGLANALNDLNNLGNNSAFNSGPLVVRVDRNHGRNRDQTFGGIARL